MENFRFFLIQDLKCAWICYYFFICRTTGAKYQKYYPPSPPSSSPSTSTSPNNSKNRPESKELKETIHHGRNKSPTIIPGQAPEEIIELHHSRSIIPGEIQVQNTFLLYSPHIRFNSYGLTILKTKKFNNIITISQPIGKTV